MSESADKITIHTLQKITYQLASSFSLHFDGQLIHCNELIRIVPAKRLVFTGSYSNNKVIVKLFVHASRARKHWSRESEGAKLLSDNNVLTPEIIAQGVSDEAIYFILFPYIEGENLALFWKENNQHEREQKLKQMMAVLNQHHNSGLAHQDLHYANFLLANPSSADNTDIYTLDGEEVKAYSLPLKKQQRLKNIALFLAQTFDLTKASSLSLLNEYRSLSSISLKERELDSFWQQIKKVHQQRIDQYLKKILRECTDVIAETHTHGYTLCRRVYHDQALQNLLEQPEHFFNSESSVYLKQGNTCTVKSVQIDHKTYVIKRYNPKGLVYELQHKGQMSRARKSWINAHLLRFMGLLTPAPVALIEQQPALGKRCSYFITQYAAGQNSWDFFCDQEHSQENKQQAADALLAVLKQFEEYKITHGDLKGSNFLVAENKIWILDLDAMTQHRTNWHYRKYWLKDKQRFLKNWQKKPCYEPWMHYFNQALFINH